MTHAQFNEAFRDHKDAVYGFAYRMAGSADTAEDVTQDCFLSLLNGSSRFDPTRGTLRCYLIGVVRNLIFKRWRAEGRFDPIAEDDYAVEDVELTAGDTASCVARAVGALPPLQREVLILAEYEGLSLKQIACAVDAEIGTVKARLHRARENLRRVLAPFAPPTRSL